MSKPAILVAYEDFAPLADWETIRDGDEVWRYGEGPWVPVQRSDIGHRRDPHYAPMRRKNSRSREESG